MKIITIIAILFCFGCESPTPPLIPSTIVPAKVAENPENKPSESVTSRGQLNPYSAYAPRVGGGEERDRYQVEQWVGQGMKSTKTFHVESNEWQIAWATKPIHNSGGGLLQIYVYRADGTLVGLVANVTGKSNDNSVMRSGAGNYYLKINSANVGYCITVSAYRHGL